jgi:hypothetical protein
VPQFCSVARGEVKVWCQAIPGTDRAAELTVDDVNGSGGFADGRVVLVTGRWPLDLARRADSDRALDIADQVSAMSTGRVVAAVRPAEIRAREEFFQIFLANGG